MQEREAWVDLLFKRGHGRNAFKTRFLYGLHREFVEEEIAQEPGRGDKLRAAALAALQSDDPKTVLQGLSFLLIVGRPSDRSVVEPLIQSRHEAVQKAAKTCQFELKRARRTR